MPLGNYELIERLGEGSSAAVFRARDVRSGAIVAVKVLKEAALIERFRNEARLLYGQLNNKHIARLIDHSLNTAPAFIVTEYCSGGSLRPWVGRSVPWMRVIQALRHAAVGLSAIHSTRGFHRDIKPDNLLLWRHPNGAGECVKLCDLGIARGAAGLLNPHATTSALGTAGYVAPELYTGGAFTASADVYSLGVTALELLTGGKDLDALRLLPCPGEVKDLVCRLLAKDPGTRPNSFVVAQKLLALGGKSTWTLQAPSQVQPDWGAVLLIGAAAVGVAAFLKSRRSG